MTTFILSVKILQVMGFSLGVGASTMTIVSFFQAIKDGTIEPIEREFLGLAYIVLRVAMSIILITTLLLTVQGYDTLGLSYFTGYVTAQWTLIVILFINAALMTARLMPSKYGPAIQASSWYSLGFISALIAVDWPTIYYMNFVIYYLLLIAGTTALINHIMFRLQKH